nr:GNAT family N-acetyltransferase [Streptomyces avermitilis]
MAANEQDQPIGALSVTAPGTIIERALEYGYSNVQAVILSVAIGKVHGLAVAEQARGQGLASFLLKRALAGLRPARLLPVARVLGDRAGPRRLL